MLIVEMKSLSYIVLALALGCGGNSSSGNHRDSSRPCPDMNSVYDQSSGKNNKKDMKDYDMNNGDSRRDGVGNTRDDVYSDSFDSGCPDMGVDSSRDEGLEGRLDLGADSGRDMGSDIGVDAGRCPPREITYPFADLVCEAPDCRLNEDCLYEFSLRRDRTFCWDASPSMAGPGRVLTNYRFFFDIIGFPEFYIDDRDPCIVYNESRTFNAHLEVEDNGGTTAGTDFYNIVSN